jgi:hypothetical protein
MEWRQGAKRELRRNGCQRIQYRSFALTRNGRSGRVEPPPRPQHHPGGVGCVCVDAALCWAVAAQSVPPAACSKPGVSHNTPSCGAVGPVAGVFSRMSPAHPREGYVVEGVARVCAVAVGVACVDSSVSTAIRIQLATLHYYGGENAIRIPLSDKHAELAHRWHHLGHHFRVGLANASSSLWRRRRPLGSHTLVPGQPCSFRVGLVCRAVFSHTLVLELARIACNFGPNTFDGAPPVDGPVRPRSMGG